MKVSDEKNVYSLASKKARRETENKREKRGRRIVYASDSIEL